MTLPNNSVFNFYEGTDPQHYTDLTGVNLNASAKQLLANDNALRTAINGLEDNFTGNDAKNALQLQGRTLDTLAVLAGGTSGNVGSQINHFKDPLFLNGTLDMVIRGSLTVTVEHPYTKGFSSPYIIDAQDYHVYTYDEATEINPRWNGRYRSFPPIIGRNSGTGNSGLNAGWAGVTGNILKVVYNGALGNAENMIELYPKSGERSGTSGGALEISACFYVESGEVYLGSHSGYNGGASNGASGTKVVPYNADPALNMWQWARGFYSMDAGFQGYNFHARAIGFKEGVASTVYIALPKMRFQPSGSTVNSAFYV